MIERQASFAELEHERSAGRGVSCSQKMDKLVHGCTTIEPFYAKAGRGRRPYPLSVMLRVHCGSCSTT